MATETPVSRRLESVKHIIIVLSGKGGVGKSSIAAQLALALYTASPRARIGVLDADLTGPSLPRMLGLAAHPVHQSSGGWVPAYADGRAARLACMSVGLLLRRAGDAVVWRGPRKSAMIRQFLSEVRWGALDFLVVDTPPGTSDEHLALLEHLAPLHTRLSALIVTTPQALALLDAAKCVSFTRAAALPVLGLVENMSGFACPCCGEVSNVFSTGGGAALAARTGLPFLGALPVDTALVTLLDAAEAEGEGEGEGGAGEAEGGAGEGGSGGAAGVVDGDVPGAFPLLQRYHATPSWPLFKEIAEKAIANIADVEARAPVLPSS